MKKYLLVALLALGLPWAVQAQAPVRPGGIGQTNRPTFSTYLNLLRRGNSTAFNYFGLVRPEMAARAAIQGLQGDVAANRDLITTGRGGSGGDTLITGNNATFLNTGGYFLSGGGGQGAAGSTAGARGGMAGGGAGFGAAPGGRRPAGGGGGARR
jgi:hypothetical protein